MTKKLEVIFPKLQHTHYRITSPPERRYNCIAWAAADTSDWWWPEPEGPAHWPEGAARALTLAAFQQAFASLGYEACDNDEVETGFEKVALYAGADGIPTHAARQLQAGSWTSKLGRMEGIEHQLDDLTGTLYGSVVLLLKRPLNPDRGEPHRLGG
jgi:hypothetical protein